MMSYPFNIQINQLSYAFSDGQVLFSNLNQTFSSCKTGLVGKNGIGKSILMQIIAGKLKPASGSVETSAKVFYVPQISIIDTSSSVAEALGYGGKLAALERIINGSIDEHDYEIVGDDWNLEESMSRELSLFGLDYISPHRLTSSLSGGEITRLQLAKAFTSPANFLLLDEPTNHLDAAAREYLYQAVRTSSKSIVMISHDRSLLNHADEIIELSTLGLNKYGGNYDDYREQKEAEVSAARQLLTTRKELADKAKRTTQIRRERHEQNEAKGRRLKAEQIAAKGSYDKMAMKAARGRSEQTNKRIKAQAERKIKHTENELLAARQKIEYHEDIHVSLPATHVPSNKVILDLENISFHYPDSQREIIGQFSFKLCGPRRIALCGSNGSGKTTLIKIIINELQPNSGSCFIGTPYISYLDQTASLLQNEKSVLENFMHFNPDKTRNEAHACLAQFLFRNTTALKNASDLSGGEKLRALLACILMSSHPPQLLILDEPTNHLDLNSIEKIESILRNYQGAMIIISHDRHFLKNAGVETIITAPFIN